MVDYPGPDNTGSIFRSALCFWEDHGVSGGVAHEAGPWAIAEFLEFPKAAASCNLSNPWQQVGRSNMQQSSTSGFASRSWAMFS